MAEITVSAKTVSDAITEASIQLGITSSELEYEVIEKGSAGFLGIGSKQAVIKAWKKVVKEVKPEPEIVVEETEVKEKTPAKKEVLQTEEPKNTSEEKLVEVQKETITTCEKFLKDVLETMGMKVEIKSEVDDDGALCINLEGENMGILIGKRGQTLDSLQYLTNRVANKMQDGYVRVKLDTENYRQRRKDTLENLARNIAHKVRRTRKPVVLEPMNPYERRIIHSALQSDKFVTTHSEGEEPYRKVVVSLARK